MEAAWELRPSRHIRACFKNIPVGLAAGRGGWLRCSSVTDFSRICSLLAPRHPPRRARNPFPSLFLKHALKETIFIVVTSDLQSPEEHLTEIKTAAKPQSFLDITLFVMVNWAATMAGGPGPFDQFMDGLRLVLASSVEPVC